MHIVIVLLLVAIFLYYYITLRTYGASNVDSIQAEGVDENASFNDKALGFISKGKLFVASGREDVKEVHSQYISDAVDRMERSKKLHGWKKDTALAMSFTGSDKSHKGDRIGINFSSALFRNRNSLLYFLKDENFGGLFEHDLSSGDEKRLIHQQKLDIQDLALGDQENIILGAQHYATGLANIVMMDLVGNESRELTAGDTVDAAPAWVGGQHAIVYQSSGLARSEDGFVVAQGPSAIQLLDLDTQEITEVLADPVTDHLQPKVDSEGMLYYIRRPYESTHYKPKHVFTDTLLFPFRLLRAVFHYLNFFSLMYSRKPLTSASGPQVEADLKDMLVKGKRIDAENALRKERPVGGVPSLVPKSWQLICRTPAGAEQVLASNVASYYLDENDNVIYSNGYGVFHLKQGGGTSLLFRDTLINELVL